MTSSIQLGKTLKGPVSWLLSWMLAARGGWPNTTRWPRRNVNEGVLFAIPPLSWPVLGADSAPLQGFHASGASHQARLPSLD